MQKKVILIVDDNKEIGEQLQQQLSDAETSVIVHSSPLEALKEFERTTPQLLVCDLVMPGINGITFIQEARKKINPDDMKVVILTNSTNMSDIADAVNLGNVVYISKPDIDFVDLIHTLKKVV
jgi:CheY-like chemotaxis protein